MFGSQSSRRRPSAKWNIKVAYSWIECVCVRVIYICRCVRRPPQNTAFPLWPHTVNTHKFLTYIHFTQTTGCQERQVSVCLCARACACWGWKSAGALGHESNAKLVLSFRQIIHDSASEMISEWLYSSSPLSLSLSLMDDVLFKISHEEETCK